MSFTHLFGIYLLPFAKWIEIYQSQLNLRSFPCFALRNSIKTEIKSGKKAKAERKRKADVLTENDSRDNSDEKDFLLTGRRVVELKSIVSFFF